MFNSFPSVINLSIIGMEQYTYERVGTVCSPDNKSDEAMSTMYVATLLCSCFILPLAVMVICY